MEKQCEKSLNIKLKNKEKIVVGKLKVFNEFFLIVILSLFLTNNYSRTLSLILVLIGAVNIYKNKEYKWKGIEKYILVYFGIQLVSLIFSVNFYHSLKEYYRHLYMLIPLFTVTQIGLNYKDKIKVLDISMGLVTIYYFVYVNLQKYGIVDKLSETSIRYYGFGNHTIVKYAFVIGIITLYYWFKILKKKEIKKKILEIIMLLFNIYLIILSGTRGAWLGITGAIVIMYILNSEGLIKAIKRVFIWGIAIIGVNIIAFKFGFLKFFEKRVLSIGNVVTDTSNTARIEMWGIAYKYFKERKITGHGYRPRLWYEISSGHKFDHPHNDYCQILVGSGILGLASYFFMMLGLLYKGIKNIKESIWLYILGIIIFILIYGLVETLIQLSIGINIFIFIISLV